MLVPVVDGTDVRSKERHEDIYDTEERGKGGGRVLFGLTPKREVTI